MPAAWVRRPFAASTAASSSRRRTRRPSRRSPHRAAAALAVPNPIARTTSPLTQPAAGDRARRPAVLRPSDCDPCWHPRCPVRRSRCRSGPSPTAAGPAVGGRASRCVCVAGVAVALTVFAGPHLAQVFSPASGTQVAESNPSDGGQAETPRTDLQEGHAAGQTHRNAKGDEAGTAEGDEAEPKDTKPSARDPA
jgi:hypothetical protein